MCPLPSLSAPPSPALPASPWALVLPAATQESGVGTPGLGGGAGRPGVLARVLALS